MQVSRLENRLSGNCSFTCCSHRSKGRGYLLTGVFMAFTFDLFLRLLEVESKKGGRLEWENRVGLACGKLA